MEGTAADVHGGAAAAAGAVRKAVQMTLTMPCRSRLTRSGGRSSRCAWRSGGSSRSSIQRWGLAPGPCCVWGRLQGLQVAPQPVCVWPAPWEGCRGCRWRHSLVVCVGRVQGSRMAPRVAALGPPSAPVPTQRAPAHSSSQPPNTPVPTQRAPVLTPPLVHPAPAPTERACTPARLARSTPDGATGAMGAGVRGAVINFTCMYREGWGGCGRQARRRGEVGPCGQAPGAWCPGCRPR